MNIRPFIYGTLVCGAVLCAICVVIIWHIVYMMNKTHVIFLNVGQGDAILITQGMHQMLIDGGADGVILQEELGKFMPFWDRTIDVVVATHADSDHIGGLVDVFDNYRVCQFWHTDDDKESSQYRALMHAVYREDGLEEIYARHNVRAHIANGVDVRVIYPFDRAQVVNVDDTNDKSIAMIISVGQEKFYMGGDLSSMYEDILPVEQMTVVKMGHHGSKESTSENFLRRVNPRDLVISVGRENVYGHPHQDVLDRITHILGEHTNVFRTDVHGSIMYRCEADRVCSVIKK